ncbi:MAG: rRNA (cytosine967-C5)-methyltransferase [Betaproteobacteria bacterium]|jgi:16S rRNA (cytosine967-C5)-methyltransferase|nr:rRNA (cytosine967-C5)-methyltransferase [Betaproteobacteria bacterium]
MSIAALAPALADAARVVSRVAAGRSLAQELDGAGRTTTRAALLDLTHGTLRRFGWVQAIVRELSHRDKTDAQVESLLWCALYALESGRYAPYTVVDQAVGACGLLEKWNAKGYVNAVLRGALRERSSLETRIAADLEARYQHPRWWIDALRAAYPEDWEGTLRAGNSHPPMCLRVNRRKTTVADYSARLDAAGIAARPLGDHGLLLERPVAVDGLPGFDTGEVSVQDAGAQRATACLDLRSGQRVLDACAAPGGKSAHILETADVELTALDSDPARMPRLARNLERLSLRAELLRADCTQLRDWWRGDPFDRILADVPCSASGIARRRPDLKWLRRAQDLESFAARQSAILDALWQALRVNGKLLYATCSVFPPENDGVISAFVSRTAGARRLQLADGGAAQWLPDAEHDGFFYALIEKTA